MDKANLRLVKLQAELNDVQSQIEMVEDRIRRKNFKRDRKAWRKKMVSNPITRLLHRMNVQMFQSEMPQPGQAMTSLLEIVNG